MEVAVRDLTYPTSVAFDDDGGLYVAEAGFAYGDPVAPASILRVACDGPMSIVADQLGGPINDILRHNGRVYISHFRKISVLQPGGNVRDLVTDLPASGGHQNNQMSIGPYGKLYFGMGTVTNSGVVGLDNDRPARDIRLRGETFLTPQPNNVLSRQGSLTSLGSNLAYAMASIFNRDPSESMLVRTGAFQPFGVSGADVVPARSRRTARSCG